MTNHKPATVSDLIKLLQTYPPDMVVAMQMYSEHCLLNLEDIRTTMGQAPRPDGWIHAVRPDRGEQPYLLFPGN